MARAKTLTSKEKYERQKALARERQQRRRSKLTAEQLEEKRKYDRDRKAKLKKEGKIKTVQDMSEREKRKMRKYWREQNHKRAQKQKAVAMALVNTPPPSPSLEVQTRREFVESIQKRRGRKSVRRDKAKAYRKVKEQSIYIKKLERKVEKYKKRLTRQRQEKQKKCSPSPKKLVTQVVGKENVSPKIRKQLFLGFVLKKQIEHQLKEVSGAKKKSQAIRKVVGNKVIKKYRVQKYFKDMVPYKCNKILSQSSDPSNYTRKKKTCLTSEMSKKLIQFYEDDSVSKMCPGKKDYVRQGRIKRQRRILLEPLANLHKRFKKESNCQLSLSTFARSRPFWVTFPKKSDRDTCACVTHSNMELLVAALKNHNIISEKNTHEVVESVVCSVQRESCMMRCCNTCKAKAIQFKMDDNFKLKYHQWKNVTEIKTVKNKEVKIKKTVKVKIVEELTEVIKLFNIKLKEFQKHVYYAAHQYGELRQKLETLKEDELLFRIDFSENYILKYHQEVQATHFGASKRQLALNTGVRYSRVNGKVKPECFASISENLDHQAHAIWAHMEPILLKAANEFPH